MNDTIIPADSARWFIRQMLQSGLSHEDMFQGTGLDGLWMKRDDAKISMTQYLQIVENALTHTGNPALGLSVGKGQMLFEYGVWGYAIMSCATAGEAMNVAFKYWELNGALVDVDIIMEDDRILWKITPSFTGGDERLIRFAVEEFLSTTAVACEFLFGQPLNAVCVHIAYPRPEHAERYRDIIHCPVMFDSENTVLILGRELMDLPTVTGHFRMKHHCENLCQELMMKLSQADKMIGIIRQHVIQSMGRFPQAEDMAHQLSMSPRTFYRRLRERNTSYQAILDEVRSELAMSYLGQTHLSVDQISDLIGFTETTTFRRAFKKWTGHSPSEYRKKKSIECSFDKAFT